MSVSASVFLMMDKLVAQMLTSLFIYRCILTPVVMTSKQYMMCVTSVDPYWLGKQPQCCVLLSSSAEEVTLRSQPSSVASSSAYGRKTLIAGSAAVLLAISAKKLSALTPLHFLSLIDDC